MDSQSARMFAPAVAVAAIAMGLLLGQASAQNAPSPPDTLRAEETAILLVDFQANFVSPEGTWYPKFAEHYKKTRMLERVVDLVKQARQKGVLVVHITEGYTQDYRELDPTNPGLFHRSQIARQAWKVGSKEAAYYEPLRPGPEDRDLFMPPRIQASGFGGNGLNEVLRSRGIKNVAVAGFTSDVCVYATVLSAYDLGYHVYALREAMVGFYPEMADQMVGSIYAMWSRVINNDDFVAMVEPTRTAAK
ncbi:MAG TPA: cysteine hydrolase family protein [Xanthobacteraceae bacterium]